jgi:hypothetical protein
MPPVATVDRASRERGPMPHSCVTRAGDRIDQFLDPAQDREQILDVHHFENASPPYLTYESGAAELGSRIAVSAARTNA